MIHSFGSNGNYQLGIGHDEDVNKGEPVLIGESVAQISSGGNHTVFATEEGELWGTGLCKNGQLGPINEDDTHITRPRKLVNSDLKFGLICSGWEFTIAVSADGKRVYSCGDGPKGELGLGPDHLETMEPKIIENFPPENRYVASLAAGMSHVLALLDDGSVYGWGAGRKGQLGVPIEKMVFRPRKLANLGQPITHISCGRDFSIIRKADGEVTVLGDDRFGIKASMELTEGQKSDFVDMDCGWGTLHILFKDGAVKSWGNNSHGQHAPETVSVSRIAVGTEHVLAIDNQNQLIAWGWGEHGNCGENHVDGQVTIILNDASNVKLLHAGYANSWYSTR